MFRCIALILFFAALLSCTAPVLAQTRWRTYDLGRSEALMQSVRILLKAEQHTLSGAEEGKLLTLLSSVDGSEQLVSLLNAREEQERLFAEAGKLLKQGRYNQIDALLAQAEQRGKATPALLRLREVPPALQALSLYCARRPYVSAADLKRAIGELRGSASALEGSPAFRHFLAAEEKRLAQMRAAENESRRHLLLSRLDMALSTAGQAAAAAAVRADLEKLLPETGVSLLLQPGSPSRPSRLFAGLLAADGAVEPRLPDGVLQAELELAVALCWNGLNALQRQGAERMLAALKPQTVVATAMQAGFAASAARFAEALRMWRQRATPQELYSGAPSFLPALLRTAVGEPSSRTHWQCAAPGVPDFLQCLADLEREP